MNSPKFNFGDIVYLDPCGGTHGTKGKIIGIIHVIDGSFDYMVSCSEWSEQRIAKHFVMEAEIVLASEAEGKDD